MAKKKSNDPKADGDKSLHEWAMTALEDGRERRRPHEAQWWENIATYAGDLWAQFSPQEGKLIESIPASHKVRLPINLAQPVVRTEIAKLTKNKPIIDALARSNEKTDLDSAKVADRMLDGYAEPEFHMPRIRRRALSWVCICGLGGIFVDYDETALGEQEVLVDPAGKPVFDMRQIKSIQRYYRDKKKAPKTQQIPQGDLVIKELSPFQLTWDQSKNFYERAAWMIVSEVYDVDEAWRRWKVDLEPEEDAIPAIMERRLLARADLTGKYNFRPPKGQRLVAIHRLFVVPGHRYFPDGAEIVFTKSEIVEKQKFIYHHGLLPVGLMGHVPFPVTQFPLAVLSQVKAPVLELSKTESQLVENRNLMGNPIWITYKQNRIDKTEIQNKPGLRLEVHFQPGVPDPHPIEMPEMPAYIQNLIPLFREHINDISGQGETTQGRVPAGARSGVAIAYLQEEDDTKLGPTVSEFEEMNERVAWLMLSNFAQFYDAPRTVRIYKKHSEPEVFDFIGTMLDGVKGVRCQAGSALPRSKAAKQQFILDLYDRGLEQDPRKIRDMLELSEGEPDEWEVDMDQAERENRKLMAGQQVAVMEWYNHPAHHYVHRRFMKSADFEALSPEAQQVFIQHDEAHSQMEQKQQMSQMVQGSMNGGAPPPGGQQGGPQQLPVGNGQNQQTAPPQFTSPDGVGNAIDYQPQ